MRNTNSNNKLRIGSRVQVTSSCATRGERGEVVDIKESSVGVMLDERGEVRHYSDKSLVIISSPPPSKHLTVVHAPVTTNINIVNVNVQPSARKTPQTDVSHIRKAVQTDVTHIRKTVQTEVTHIRRTEQTDVTRARSTEQTDVTKLLGRLDLDGSTGYRYPPPYIASNQFNGPKPSYTFRNGTNGIGYYWDTYY